MGSFFAFKSECCFFLLVFWFCCLGSGKFPASVCLGDQARKRKQTLCSAESSRLEETNFKHKLTPSIFRILQPAFG